MGFALVLINMLIEYVDLRLLAVAVILTPRHSTQTGSRAHRASYPVGTGVSSPGDKAAGA
jgi:hypothetical protein